MTGLTFQTVTLGNNAPDCDAALVYHEGCLLAVLTRLSEMHAELAGKWFLEATFGIQPVLQPPLFDKLEDYESWLARGN